MFEPGTVVHNSEFPGAFYIYLSDNGVRAKLRSFHTGRESYGLLENLSGTNYPIQEI